MGIKIFSVQYKEVFPSGTLTQKVVWTSFLGLKHPQKYLIFPILALQLISVVFRVL